jgi:hypothetical protein
MGCYLASACFYEMIFGRSILENKFELPDVDKGTMEILKICAHTAVEKGIILKQ